MNSAFLVSYCSLAGLVVFEAIAANAIYRRMVPYQRALERRLKNGWNGLPLLSDVPAFRALDLRSGTVVANSEFQGRAAVLVFVSVQMPVSLILWVLATTRSRLPGDLHLVCDGSQTACVALYEQCAREAEIEIGRVLWDEGGRLTKKFGIQTKPSVVAVDSAGCVQKAGSLTMRNASQAPGRRLRNA